MTRISALHSRHKAFGSNFFASFSCILSVIARWHDTHHSHWVWLNFPLIMHKHTQSSKCCCCTVKACNNILDVGCLWNTRISTTIGYLMKKPRCEKYTWEIYCCFLRQSAVIMISIILLNTHQNKNIIVELFFL